MTVYQGSVVYQDGERGKEADLGFRPYWALKELREGISEEEDWYGGAF